MPKKPNDPEAVRRARLRQLFTARIPEKTTGMTFFFSSNGFNSITLRCSRKGNMAIPTWI